MDTPQEVQVWFILAAVRRQYVVSLKKLGLKQKEIATALNLTESAVSQYLSNKRGKGVSFTPKLRKEINISAQKVANDRKELNPELQKIMRKIKDSKFICTVCHTHVNTADDCNICFV